MSAYPVLKWLHVLSSVVLVGTGFGTAYFMYFANRSASVPAQAVVTRLVVRADLWFTTPAVVLQPLTGIALDTGRLAAHDTVDRTLDRPVPGCGRVLAAGRAVADAPARSGACCACGRQRVGTGLLGSGAALGAARLSGVHRDGGGVLPDGGQVVARRLT